MHKSSVLKETAWKVCMKTYLDNFFTYSSDLNLSNSTGNNLFARTNIRNRFNVCQAKYTRIWYCSI